MQPDLGFASGDYVVNKPGDTIQPYSEHCLVCKIRDEFGLHGGHQGELWWAWDDRTFRMYQVLCGKWWVLNPQRTVQRKAFYIYDWEKKEWVARH